MGTKNNPGTYDCYVNAEDDEPMFVLLGRDVHAAALVEEWANVRHVGGESPEKVRDARQCAEDMRAWCTTLGKLPKLLAKPKWALFVENSGSYFSVLCYTDEEMENEYIAAQQDECHPAGDEEETEFEKEARNYLRARDNWGPTRCSLTTVFEDGNIEIRRLNT